ncbi:CRISPR-associated endonuclease Cas1 [Micromonospora deserti]|uniref:CRISPR-associated endonuclease Cas1 n=1 Tax=Micromonospora deserti TaxID=2070366 RepID=UPI000DA70F99|nr:CRISPR-associated endonuclease Cas1 [Micromonospora deserti]
MSGLPAPATSCKISLEKAHSMRFPGENTANLTMQQLRGKEGARVRRTYHEHGERTGVAWRHRDYDRADFAGGDPINQALSAAHACLYGIVHTVIVALGAASGLGFFHTGHERAFVYDIADLYKAEITIPVAFDVVVSGSTDMGTDARRAVRDRVHDGAILARLRTHVAASNLTVNEIRPLINASSLAQPATSPTVCTGHTGDAGIKPAPASPLQTTIQP